VSRAAPSLGDGVGASLPYSQHRAAKDAGGGGIDYWTRNSASTGR